MPVCFGHYLRVRCTVGVTDTGYEDTHVIVSIPHQTSDYGNALCQARYTGILQGKVSP